MYNSNQVAYNDDFDYETINSQQSLFEEHYECNQTPINNNKTECEDDEPSGVITPTNQCDSQEQLNRERINCCIEEFTKLWGPGPSNNETGGDGQNVDNNRIDDSAFSIRCTSIRYKSIPDAGLTVEIDPNAWELPGADLICFTNNEVPKNQMQGKVNESCNGDSWISNESQNIDEAVTNDFSDDDDGVDYDTIRIVLDPELRPSTPEPNNFLSKNIFEEHNKLAKEYLRVNITKKK